MLASDARAEQQRRALAGEAREPLLEPAVQRHRPARRARGARADAPAHRRVRRRLAHLRMIGEPEALPEHSTSTGRPSSTTRGP